MKITFDYKTAADFLNGKEIVDENVRKFVHASRWAHEEVTSLRLLVLDLQATIKTREAEIELLKKMLLDVDVESL